MSQLRTTVFQYFQTDDIPTESQFQYSWSSVWFKDEKFSISNTSGLETALQNKLGTAHTSDENAHVNSLAKLNASNLNDDQKEAWKNALGVGEIPENVALVDLGESTQVYNKAQIHEISMMLADFVNGGKIRADKIEALGLTDLIEASENTLAAFVDNTDAYEFQKNDFIAIPDVNGNHSLFMFKGEDKTLVGSYLATGLSNITIPMVEGLQMALNGKLDKPASSGDFYLSKTIVDGIAYYQYKVINLQPGQIPRSFGGYIGASTLFEDNGGKIGIGTNLPSEQLQLTGRGRMKALVLEENTESLPGQITRSGNRFSGTNASGVKKGFLYNDLDDITSVVSVSTDAQKEAWRIAQRKSGEVWSLGTPQIDTVLPPIIDGSLDYVQYVSVIGLNLFVDNESNNAEVKIYRVKDESGTVINPDANGNYPDTFISSTIEVFKNNASTLVMSFNFNTLPKGTYRIKVRHGSLINASSPEFSVLSNLTYVNVNTPTWEVILRAGGDTGDIVSGFNIAKKKSDVDSGLHKSLKSTSYVPAQDVLGGFMIELQVSWTTINSYVNERDMGFKFGLGYDKDITVPTGIDLDLVKRPFQIGALSTDMIYYEHGITGKTYSPKWTVIVRNGSVIIIARLENKVKVVSSSFVQKNEDLHFYIDFFGSGLPGLSNDQVYNIALPNKYVKF